MMKRKPLIRNCYVLYRTDTLEMVRYYTYQKAAHNACLPGLSVTDITTFTNMRENGPTKMVKNLMTGKMVEIAADTPWCCNPASETYWSM